MRGLFKGYAFVVCLLCFVCFFGNMVYAMETGYFTETNNDSSSEGYEDKVEIESPFPFRTEVFITQEANLQRNTDDITNFTVNLYNSETDELWTSVKGSANYTYSDGVYAAINGETSASVYPIG